MSAAHDPIHQLEPANLLEPLDLADEHVDEVDSSASSDRGGARSAGATRTSASEAMPRSVAHGGRRPLKTALIVGGAVICFAAGAMLSRTPPFGASKPSETMGSATRESAPPAATPVASDQPKLVETKSNEPAPQGASPPLTTAKPGEPSQATATPPTATPGRWTDPDPAAKDGSSKSSRVVPPSTAASPSTAGQPAPQATRPAPEAGAPRSADSQRTDARASSRPEEQSSRSNRRAARRDKADQQFNADDDGPTASTTRTLSRRRGAPDESGGREDRRSVDRATREDGRADDAAFGSTGRDADHGFFGGGLWRQDERREEPTVGRAPREGSRASGRVTRERERRDERESGRPARDDAPVLSFPFGGENWFGR